MNPKNLKTLALGAAIAGSLAAMPAAQANPFSLSALGQAYLAADGDAHFPRWHEGDFEERSRREGAESGTNSLPTYHFVTYERTAPKGELD